MGGINKYAYVRNNPVNRRDFFGLAEDPLKEYFPNVTLPKEVEDFLDNFIPIGGVGGTIRNSCKVAEAASEKTAIDIAKQIERDLGKEARREFHDMKELGDRTIQELKEAAKYLYDQAGKQLPRWLR